MPTYAYQGTGQPPLDNGASWLGRIGSIFGGQTPTYLGDGQPSTSVGVLGRVTPAYMPAPATQETVKDDQISAEAQMSCPIDPAALAAGHIAIVIPRNCGVPEREEQPATD